MGHKFRERIAQTKLTEIRLLTNIRQYNNTKEKKVKKFTLTILIIIVSDRLSVSKGTGGAQTKFGQRPRP